ncbi:MAG: DUF4032 domain-containing protein [Acidobacteriota bacterium]
MPIPFRLEYVIEKTLVEPDNLKQKALRKLAGVKLSHTEALTIWNRILDHKWFLSERLGRDVGMRVASIDYFENIYSPRQRHHNEFYRLMRRLMRPLISYRVISSLL